VAAIARRFRAARLHYGHGTACARDEAAWLVAHVLGRDPRRFAAYAQTVVPPALVQRARRLAARRVRERTPLAYLLGEAWLDGRRFHVDRRAIVPRSFIAEALRTGFQPWHRRPVYKALDLGTGSGCLAVLLALHFPRARVDAVDLSRAALCVAAKNVARHGVARRVRLVQSDLFQALGRRRYDLIVANPPYVERRMLARLPAEYRREPRLALDGGAKGLRVLRRILQQARMHLRPHGLLVCETGDARAALERAFPLLPFIWLPTSEPESCVFALPREALPGRRPQRGPRT